MPWENLADEIADEFEDYSTVSDERLDRYYRWSLNWFRNRRSAKYVEGLRFEQSRRRQRFMEKVKGTYCSYCFGPIVHDYEKSCGHVRLYCCSSHSRKATAYCFRSWRLPVGDVPCLYCTREYHPSLLAPEVGFCSSCCARHMLEGRWLPWTSITKVVPVVRLKPRLPCSICGGWDTPGCRVCKYRRMDRAKIERRKMRLRITKLENSDANESSSSE